MAAPLAGRVAVVTGGASGIGEEFCRLAAGKGAHVAVLDVQREAGERVAASLRHGSPPARAIFVFCDVTRRDSIVDAFAAVRRRLGVPTIVVNNACVLPHSHRLARRPAAPTPLANAPPRGVVQTTQLLEDDADTWRGMIDINLTGVIQVRGCPQEAMQRRQALPSPVAGHVFALAGSVRLPVPPVCRRQGTKAGAKAMIEAGEQGCIVNVSSQAGASQSVSPPPPPPVPHPRVLAPSLPCHCVTGLVATPLSPVYCATKWGVVGFTRSMAPLAAEGVRVVAVCPAFTDTALVRTAVAKTPALRDAIEGVQRRLLSVGEVAAQMLRLVETGEAEGAAPGRCLEVGAGGSRFVRFRGDPKAPTAAL